jgi:hypothetical protein
MRYLKFESSGGAEQRSRELWGSHLGRPKKPEDATEFMYSWEVAESDDGGSYLIIHDEGTLLTSTETGELENEDSFQQWRQTHQPVEYASDLEENS